MPEMTLSDILRKTNALATPVDLGWDSRDYASAIAHAPFTRDRFTFLDLAA